DDADVVAAEDVADLVVVRHLRVAARQHALERVLDAQPGGKRAEDERHPERGERDRPRVTHEPPREGVHPARDYIQPSGTEARAAHLTGGAPEPRPWPGELALAAPGGGEVTPPQPIAVCRHAAMRDGPDNSPYH